MNKRKILTYVLWLYGLSFGIAALFFLSGLESNILLLSIFMTGYMFFSVNCRLYRPKINLQRSSRSSVIVHGTPKLVVGGRRGISDVACWTNRLGRCFVPRCNT